MFLHVPCLVYVYYYYILYVCVEADENPLVSGSLASMWKWSTDVDDSKQRLNSEWARVLENISSLGKECL